MEYIIQVWRYTFGVCGCGFGRISISCGTQNSDRVPSLEVAKRCRAGELGEKVEVLRPSGGWMREVLRHLSVDTQEGRRRRSKYI